MPPTLYLIDGHALAYRMYFALTAVGGSQRWQTSKGEPTAGIYGFARELLRILEQEKPEYLAVAFDVGKTFRDDLFPEYKGTREKMPDDLRPQIERIRKMVDAFNIPRLEMEGFEADDVLGPGDAGIGQAPLARPVHHERCRHVAGERLHQLKASARAVLPDDLGDGATEILGREVRLQILGVSVL